MSARTPLHSPIRPLVYLSTRLSAHLFTCQHVRSHVCSFARSPVRLRSLPTTHPPTCSSAFPMCCSPNSRLDCGGARRCRLSRVTFIVHPLTMALQSSGAWIQSTRFRCPPLCHSMQVHLGWSAKGPFK